MNGLKRLWVIILTILCLLPSSTLDEVQAASQTINFAESTDRTPSQTITIKNLKKVNSITVDNGQVSHSVNGEKITINASEGTPVRDVIPRKTVNEFRTSYSNSFNESIPFNNGGFSGNLLKKGYSTSRLVSGSFTPSDTKTVSDSRTSSSNSFPSSLSYDSGGYKGTLNKSGSVSKTLISGSPAKSKEATDTRRYSTTQGYCSDAKSYALSQLPSSISYNSGGYTGTLSLVSSSTSDCSRHAKEDTYSASATGYYSGTVWSRDTSVYSYTQLYSGTVTKAAHDSRVYEYKQEYEGEVTAAPIYYYAYKASLNFTANEDPVITDLQTDKKYVSLNDGFDSLVVTGSISDPDDQKVEVTVTVDHISKKLIFTNTKTSKPFTFKFDKADIESLSEGIKTVIITAKDIEGGEKVDSSKRFTIDKTAPLEPTITEEPPGYSDTKTITITFSTDTIKKEYQIDNDAWKNYTEPFIMTKNAVIKARATDISGNVSETAHEITKISPPNPVGIVSGVSTTGFTITDTQKYMFPVEYQFELYKDGEREPFMILPKKDKWQDEASYMFTNLKVNTKYQGKIKVRFK
ncbi:hypothetical protein D5F52_26640 (plasmid) [Brevibacillus laterosporus]|uniref:hypothetical protein n=1 Tax=Brevibacillus laterosporus TaxID=1465 RepID=UPI000E6D4162|nr:hypothetical protein [Brevibacillus laterosporus]AYB41734.1 hypothetical protein D5F52_26640 [Brevibacillus laterosporus]